MLLTSGRKTFNNISYDFRGDGDESDTNDREEASRRAEQLLKAKGVDLTRRTRGEKITTTDTSAEDRRRKHQAELAKQLEEEAKQRLKIASKDTSDVSLCFFLLEGVFFGHQLM